MILHVISKEVLDDIAQVYSTLCKGAVLVLVMVLQFEGDLVVCGWLFEVDERVAEKDLVCEDDGIDSLDHFCNLRIVMPDGETIEGILADVFEDGLGTLKTDNIEAIAKRI